MKLLDVTEEKHLFNVSSNKTKTILFQSVGYVLQNSKRKNSKIDDQFH